MSEAFLETMIRTNKRIIEKLTKQNEEMRKQLEKARKRDALIKEARGT